MLRYVRDNRNLLALVTIDNALFLMSLLFTTPGHAWSIQEASGRLLYITNTI